jgi:replicative DNA helicase
MLADFRESGALEQDSDITILLYRDDAYEPESPRAGEIDLIVAKNRQGPKGVASLAFRGHYATCADLYREPIS